MRAFQFRRQWPVLALVSIALVGCGGDDGGPPEPEPVAQVQVTSTVTSIPVGQTTQLTVSLLDGEGNALTGRTVAWTSSNDNFAQVSTSGLVTGVAAGNVTITATSEGRSGTVQLAITGPPGDLTLTGISPATLQPGQPATLTGTGFAASTTGNVVTIGGEIAIITAATATEIAITVPSGVCLPTGNLQVVVSVGSLQSSPRSHPFQSDAAPLAIPVGQLTLLDQPASLCLRFGATAANEAYVFGLQSTVSTAATLTAARVNAAVPGATASAQAVGPSLAPFAVRMEPVQLTSERQERWRRHRQAEAEFRSRERPLITQALAATRALRRSPTAMAEAQAAAAIPASVNVGDTLDIRVPLLTNSCSNFAAIRAVVRVVGQRGVWLDDVGNPAGGLSTADFQSLSTRFDSQIFAVNTDWFGQPSDFDGNARAVIVVTKEVNKQENVLGFVAAADMFPRATCESSDFGEIYYGRSADPSGTFGDEYSVENTRLDAVQLIGHEFTHIIQFGRRIQDPADPEVQTVWELEGQAVLAEEINGHAATGRTGGQNYGFGVAYCGLSSQADPCDIPHYADAFIDMAIYFGLSIDDNNTPFRIQNAPEQCSWLGRRTQENNTGPCLSGREVYGTPWSFLRWLTDNFGASTPGGGQALHRALVDDNSSGFQTIANVTGTPQINLLLAQWAATLWLDDRETGMQDRLTMSSWNLRSVFQATFSGVPSGLQPRERSFSAFNDAVSVRGGSSAYYTIGGANRPATFIGFRRQDGSQLPNGMQVWVVRTR